MRSAAWALGVSGVALLAACSSSADGPGAGAGGTAGAAGSGGAAATMTLHGKSSDELCAAITSGYTDPPGAPSSDCDVACNPGTITSVGVQAMRQRIDFYRRWLGLPAVGDPEPAWDDKAQQCAMMMAVAQKLSHTPGTDWPCYTPDGAAAAGQSNIGLENSTPGHAIDSYIFDYGNQATLGHRRWILFPGFKGIGYGFFDGGPGGTYGEIAASCVVAFDGPVDYAGAATELPVAYPPAGAFPAALASFDAADGTTLLEWTLSWEGASFAAASLTMTDVGSGEPLALAIPFGELPASYGSNAAAWQPSQRPAVGDVWRVHIDGVVHDGAAVPPIEYDVEMVDCGVKPLY